MQNNRNAYQIKDKKIQFFRVDVEKQGNIKKFYKHYIYPKSIYDEHGLWAFVRSLMTEEKIKQGRSSDIDSLKVQVCNNSKINEELKAEFNGRLYDVKNVDPFEFYVDDINLVLVRSLDKTTYQQEVRYDNE